MGYYTQLFDGYGLRVGQVLLTADDVTRHSHYRNAYRTFGRLLELGVVPIVNENDTVATHEIRFGDNDRLAALVAHLVHANALVLLSDVSSALHHEPSQAPRRARSTRCGARPISPVSTLLTRGTAVGTGGMITKIDAARIATSAGIPVVLTTAEQAAAALAGEEVGHAVPPHWPPATDSAAVAATRQRRSWHPGSRRGRRPCADPAQRVAASRPASPPYAGSSPRASRSSWSGRMGLVVARGLVNYDSDELPALLGRSTRDLAAELGAGYDRTVVHRDALVVIESADTAPDA